MAEITQNTYESFLSSCKNQLIHRAEHFLAKRSNQKEIEDTEIINEQRRRGITKRPRRFYSGEGFGDDSEQISDHEIEYEKIYKKLRKIEPEQRIFDPPKFMNLNWTKFIEMDAPAFPQLANKTPLSPKDHVLDRIQFTYQEMGRRRLGPNEPNHIPAVDDETNLISHHWTQRFHLTPPERGINNPPVSGRRATAEGHYTRNFSALHVAIKTILQQHVKIGVVGNVFVAGAKTTDSGALVVKEDGTTDRMFKDKFLNIEPFYKELIAKDVGEVIQEKRPPPDYSGKVDHFCFAWQSHLESEFEDELRVEMFKDMVPGWDKERNAVAPGRLIYTAPNSDFWAHVGDQSAVIGVRPWNNFRQQLADVMYETGQYAPIIICETVDPLDHEYPDLNIPNPQDPGHPLLNWILNYMDNHYISFQLPEVQELGDLGKLSLYMRHDAYKP